MQGIPFRKRDRVFAQVSRKYARRGNVVRNREGDIA
jgi:hypothetical protein